MIPDIFYPDAVHPEPVQEAGFIHAALAGDLSAFNQLVMIYQDSLYGWVFSLVQDAALADDLTQLAFIKAYEKLSTFRGGSLRSWLFRIARNASYDELRRQKRYPTVSLDDSSDEDHALLSALPDRAPLPEDAFEAAELSNRLAELLRRLPGMFQQVLWLVDIEQLDYQEAADVLGLPIGTLKSRLSRARLNLRQLYLQTIG